MAIRLAKPVAAAALLLGLWGLDSLRDGRPIGVVSRPAAAGHVRILAFYSSAGALLAGERTSLCYGVENAKSVSIAPLSRNVYPSKRFCFDIVPNRTTHYTLMAEGYDGTIDARTLTVPVHAAPPPRTRTFEVATVF